MPAHADERPLAARVRLWAAQGWGLAKRTTLEFFDDKCTQHAAAISYYTLFALFPLAILIVVGFGLFASDEAVRERVIELVESNLPISRGEGRVKLRSALEGVTENPGAVGLGGAAGLAFAASGLMGALRTALNAAWDVTDTGRSAVTGKLVDFGLVLATGAVIAVSFALTLTSRLATSLDSELGGIGGTLTSVVLALGQLGPLLIATGIFAFLYRVVPAADVSLRDALPAALIAALAFELLKTGFSIYVENFRDYSAVYGSIGAVIAFLFFVFLAANVFLAGAELGAELGVRRRRLTQRR